MGGFPRDSLDERFHSKVMSLDTLPKAQLFQFFPRKNRWKLITRGENATGNRYVQADAWNAPVCFSSFSTLGQGSLPLIYPGQEEIVFISNGTSPRASFSPPILAQGGEELSVGPRCNFLR